MFLKYQGLGQCAQAPSTESKAIPSLLLPVLSSTRLSPHTHTLCWATLPLPGASPMDTCSLFLSLHSAQGLGGWGVGWGEGEPFPFLMFPWGASSPRVNPSKKTLEVTLPFTFFTHSCPREKAISDTERNTEWKKHSAMLTHLSPPWPLSALHRPLPWGAHFPLPWGGALPLVAMGIPETGFLWRPFPTHGSAHKPAGGGDGVNTGKPKWNGTSQLGLPAALSW